MSSTLVAIGLAISSFAFATEGTQASTISQLYSYQEHTGLLVRLATMSDLGGRGSSGWYVLPDNHVHYKEISTMLMGAKLTNAPVEITVSDCYEGYGRIKHVMLTS